VMFYSGPNRAKCESYPAATYRTIVTGAVRNYSIRRVTKNAYQPDSWSLTYYRGMFAKIGYMFPIKRHIYVALLMLGYRMGHHTMGCIDTMIGWSWM
jgi:hypothetical protein